MRNSIFITAFSLILLAGCYREKKIEKGASILSQEETANVLCALTMYEAYLNSGGNHPALADTNLRISPFQQYNVRPSQFDSSITYYTQIPEEMQQIQEKVIEKINAIRESDR